MELEDAQIETVGSGPVAQVTHDDMSVGSNTESAEEMKKNFATEEKPKDGDPETDEEKRSKAASELGKAGGKAAAAKRAAEKAEPEAEEKAEAEAEPEAELEAEEAEPEKAEAKPRNDARARVMQATQRLAEERRRADQAEAKLAQLQAAKASPAPSTDELRPRPELYSTEDEYRDALMDWKVDQKIQSIREDAAREARQQAQVQAVVSRIDGFNARVEAATKADPEVLDRVNPALLGMTPTFLLHPDQQPTQDSDIAQGIIESEHSAALLLHLSDHPEELARLRQQPDSFAVARALGALEAKVSSAPAPDPRPVPAAPKELSKAAPPVRPVSGSPQHAEDTVDGDTDFDEFVRVSNLRDQRRRSGR